MRDPEFLDRTSDAIQVMGQAAHDYGPGSPEAQGAAKAIEDMYAEADDDTQGR